MLLLAEVAPGEDIAQFIRQDLTAAISALQFECMICGHATKERSNLRKHIANVHGTHEEHICHVCNKVYKNKTSLKDHLRRTSCAKRVSHGAKKKLPNLYKC